jgi:hypothetical protein
LINDCLFTYRISLSRFLQEKPFFLIYGRDPVLPADLTFPTMRKMGAEDLESYKVEKLKTLRKAYEKLMDTKDKGQSKYKEYYDCCHKNVNFELVSYKKMEGVVNCRHIRMVLLK